MAGAKKTGIQLSPHVILTDNGVGFFMDKGYKLRKINTAEGIPQYGVKLAQVSPSSFQYMLKAGYLSRLELCRPEFTSVRSDIMDFSKLIAYGLLYMHFDQVLFDKLVNSSFIREWNRANPKKVIDAQTRINDAYLKSVLSDNAAQIKSIRKAISSPILRKVGSDNSLQADEKNIMIFLTDRLLDNIRPFTWFILSRFNSLDDHKLLVHETRRQLDNYLQRSKIVDYLSLLLMELAISAETLNMTSFARKKYGQTTDIHQLLFDPERKKLLIQDLEQAEANLTLAWSIGDPLFSAPGTGKKLELTIYNREAPYAELREKVQENIKSAREVPLSRFYKGSTAGNAEMGLLYLGYLQDECDKVGIRLVSQVGEGRDGVPFISVILRF